jgi:glutathionylspermidine synthase
MTMLSNRPPPAYSSPMETEDLPVSAGPQLSPAAFSTVRRRAVLEGCKWDPQVGDIIALAPFPLVMKRSVWRRIARQAEHLAAETVAAEEEIIARPVLVKKLGLPLALLNVLAARKPMTPAPGRVMRFDFHYTTDGWRISEVNSDVPGGFTEASHFTAMMAQNYPGLRPAGDPARMWSDALADAAPEGLFVMLSAPGYMEDHQVIAYLARTLRERRCKTHLANPRQIRWLDGVAYLNATWYRGPVDAIVRFYQAEWLARLPAKTGWANFLRGGKTLVANPASAIISESKRFPLLWDRLCSAMPTWRALLPETCDPRYVPWERDSQWLLKRSMCNTGDSILIPERLTPTSRLRTKLTVRMWPGAWVAQRRFESMPLSTPVGPRHFCIGVYMVNGSLAGAYARMSEKRVIDFEATDVALLLQDDD